jgi:hypothetical protein
MNAKGFVTALSRIELTGVFNPYRQRCSAHDLANGAALRKGNLQRYLEVVQSKKLDTIWMGRDLGYRGGRRTGLALTDEAHLSDFGAVYLGSSPLRATKGPIIAERTASEIWTILKLLKQPPLLWNVFPLHPYDSKSEMTNRRFTARELSVVNELNAQLIEWLQIRRIVCIGKDAMRYAATFGVAVDCVRHPSYGGVNDFRLGMHRIYGSDLLPNESLAQTTLF